MAQLYNQWSSAKPFMPAAPAGLVDSDALRVRAYDVYEQMYWNHPETFKLLQRGEDSNPIYLPSAKRIIEATNRFLAVDWDYVINPSIGVDTDQQALNAMIGNLFRREQMFTKFAMQRRYGLIWGDAIWHVTADPNKPQGTRISINTLHPGKYFPIYNGDSLIGVHLVDLTTDPRDKTKQVNRRQTYRKTDNGQITTELALFELGKWDDRNLEPKDIKLIQQLVNPTALPPAITTIPVYHVRNQETPGNSFGSSEIRGIETVLSAANQAVTDQDLALAMAGLGVYWTDAGPPVDANGNPVDFDIGPARMIEVPPGQQVGRLQGVGSIDPSLAHINFVLDQAQTGIGIPDIAAGKVDVSIAESGIALRLQLAPILAKNAEKEQSMLGVYDHLFYDLNQMWLPAYEGFTQGQTCEIASVVGDALPQDRAGTIAEIIQLVTAQIMPIEFAQAKLQELGYNLGADALEKITTQTEVLAAARAYDPFANRYNNEIENTATGEGAPSGAVTS